MDVRQAWQFPAAQALLSLLSPSHSVPATTPTSLEDALRTADSPLLAQVHAKLLRLPPSSQHKWRASILRYIANHPQYFDNHIPQPQDDDAYEDTTPHERLLLLHALAEAVLSEHPPVAPVEQLRPYPIGVDALKNQYWYFGDAQRVYREPGEAAKKKAEKETNVSELQRKAAEKDARRREREEKREAIERRREEKRKRDAEKWAPRAAVGRSTRASHRLKREADQQQEQAKVGGDANNVEDMVDEAKESWLLHEIGFSSDENDEKEDEKESKQQTKKAEAPRRSGRRRKPAQQLASPPPKRPRKKDPSPPSIAPPPPPPPPKRKEFSDPTLRACSHWETVSINAHELRVFIERFGPREKLAPVERALLKGLDEIIPEMDEAEAQAKREADRKAKTQFLLLNQKRSTRVQALNARREEEARREAEREEKEREEANRIAAHERAVFEAISFLVREQSRDIRGARREFGMDDAINRDEVAIQKQEKEKILLMAAAAPVRRSARMHRAMRSAGDETGPKTSPEADAGAVVEATGEAGPHIIVNCDVDAIAKSSNDAVANTTAEPTTKADRPTVTVIGAGDGSKRQSDEVLDVEGKEVLDEPHSSNGEQLEPGKENAVSVSNVTEPSGQAEGKSTTNDLEDHGTTIDSMDDTAKSSPGAERALEHEPKPLRFTSATDEENVGPAFTWSTNDEDKLPMRVLDKFFFASSVNFADAPLEDCENPKSNMVGFGILLPPTSAPPDVVRVEISRIVEWMFEYGGTPKIWIKSEHAWYELREPAVEYQEVFVSARRKFEICARVAIMGDTMRGAQLNYSSILDYLSYPYGNMLAYQDSDVLTEKRYVVSQIELLNKRSLLQSGFIRELQKRIRAEDRKAAQERAKAKTHEAALEMKREEEFASMKVEDMVIVSPTKAKLKSDKPAGTERKSATKSKEDKKSLKDKISKRAPRKRGVKPVPRVVSSIINGIFRAATKSYKPPRKRKPKSENGPPKGNKNSKGVESPKKSLPTLIANGVKQNESVPRQESRVNGYHPIGQTPIMNGTNGGISLGNEEGADGLRQNCVSPLGRGNFSSGKVGGTVGTVSSIRPASKKEKHVHPLMPKMVGHGMSAFVALPRPLVGEVHRENGFSDGKKE